MTFSKSPKYNVFYRYNWSVETLSIDFLLYVLKDSTDTIGVLKLREKRAGELQQQKHSTDTIGVLKLVASDGTLFRKKNSTDTIGVLKLAKARIFFGEVDYSTDTIGVLKLYCFSLFYKLNINILPIQLEC